MKERATPFGLICLGLAAAAALFPLVAPNPYLLSVAALAFINALAAAGLNLIAGYTGQLNLAHMPASWRSAPTRWASSPSPTACRSGWPSSRVASSPPRRGALVGLVSLRLRGQVFAIFTLCVGVIIALVIEKADGLTNGVNGIMDIPRAMQIGPVSIDNDAGQYELVLAFLVAGLFLMQRIVTSLVGRGFVAIRNGEALAEALGINLMRTKLLAFVLSTFYAGIAGALYAGNLRFLGPGMASETVTFDLITYVIVGGMGTLLGPVVGALVVAWLSQYLQALQDYRMVVLGPVLIALIMFFPKGIVGWIETWLGRRRAARIDAKLATTKIAEPKLAERPHA